eukprot:TRINITY_DN6765_c0_g1_i1.p1 TRINITY_DN6765_c0_g1~~TRINITY_DN6765_c0_g1_i1.p1  ORF type:complete len:318 (-),score=31.57 TRINITY_DN6765_c0_g1_i1:260-1159(-)
MSGYGQIVVGPPGCGKTTYCAGLQQFLQGIGRKVSVVNLDPGNDEVAYECDVDVREIIHVEKIQQTYELGPNGGLIFGMELLMQNLDWLKSKLEPLLNEGNYLLFDCPGQVELITLHKGFHDMIEVLTREWDLRLAAIHMIDGNQCTDAGKYLGGLLLSLNCMLHLALPHVNVMSKMDILKQYGELQLPLEFYTEVQDLSYLVQCIREDPLLSRYKKLTEGLCSLVEDYSLVRFMPLEIENKESVASVLTAADQANGYVYSGLKDKMPYKQVQGLYGDAAAEETQQNKLNSNNSQTDAT